MSQPICFHKYLSFLPKNSKQQIPLAMAQSQSYYTTGTEKNGYSLVHGSVGENYDIVLAVRQTDSFGNSQPNVISKPKDSFSKPQPNDFSKQKKSSSSSSDDSSDDEKNKKRGNGKLPPQVEGATTNGPWGGTGGSVFNDGTYTGIRQINVSRNVGIVSMKVCYDQDGKAVWGSKHGGTGGFKHDMVIFDYPYEILTQISGTYGPLMYMGPNVIRSLTFHTTKGKHGPIGEEQGQSFSHKIEGKIVGFHGRNGLFVDAIGVYVKEGKITPASHPVSNAIVKVDTPIAEIDNPQWSNKLLVAKQRLPEEVACGVIKEPAPCGPGPWGGVGGKPWDDGVFSGIKQIFVTRAEAIYSIQIEYDRNGQSVWSAKHGGNGGTHTHRMKLDYPDEVLNCISGYYGPISKDERPQVVRSLTFYTSRGKYGPFGEEVGTFFTSTTTEGKVVGFHGRSSFYLDAIGMHMQHWLGNVGPARPSRFKFLK